MLISKCSTPVSAALASLGIVALGLNASFGASSVPAISTPSVPAVSSPQPNAYDYYLKAGAALDYKAPRSALPAFDGGSSDPVKVAPFKSPLERNEAVLKANTRTLELLRQGFAFEYRNPRRDSQSYVDSNSYLEWTTEVFSFNARMRQLARVLMLESHVHASKGDWGRAAQSALDALRLGQDMSHGAMTDMLVGLAVQSIGRKSLRDTLNNIDSANAQAATKRFEEILSGNVEYADVLVADKHLDQQHFKRMAAEPDWRKEFPTSKTLQELEDTYLKAMDGLIANARLPYPLRKVSIEQPDDPLNRTMLGLYSDPEHLPLGATQGLQLARNQAQNAFLLVELALRGYMVEHGSYAASLDVLVTTYLQRISDDPFAEAGPLRYKGEGKKYTLYSVGPDGKDDGGQPITDKPMHAGSKGDIVAGVNQ